MQQEKIGTHQNKSWGAQSRILWKWCSQLDYALCIWKRRLLASGLIDLAFLLLLFKLQEEKNIKDTELILHSCNTENLKHVARHDALPYELLLPIRNHWNAEKHWTCVAYCCCNSNYASHSNRQKMLLEILPVEFVAWEVSDFIVIDFGKKRGNFERNKKW